MAGKDKQDLLLLDIEYAIIHPVIENVDDNVRKESTEKQETEKERLKRIADMFLARPAYGKKIPDVSRERKRYSSNDRKNPDRHAVEYAAISPVSENAVDNHLKDTTVRQETEEERLKRIADMFLARPAYSNDKCKIAWDVKKEDEKVTSKQIKKEKRKHNKKAKQNYGDDRSDGIEVIKPIEAFLDLEKEPADDNKKREKFLGCFGFIRACLEKRRMKRFEKELMKKTKDEENMKDFSDIIVRIG